jgi:hypothetical protein
MKIPAPLTVPATLGLFLLTSRGERRKARAWVALAAPFAVVAVWLAYHQEATGWLLWRPGRRVVVAHDPATLARRLLTVADMLLLGQWRGALLVAAGGALLWVRIARGSWVPLRNVAPHVAILATGCAFFAAVGEFGLRYGLYLLPSYLVAMLCVVRAALPRALSFVAGGAALFAAFVVRWHPHRPPTSTYVFRPDEDLAYRDMIAIGQRSARWLEREFPDAEIYGTEPESYQLTEPWHGYVDAPLRFAPCSAFERHPDRVQIVYVHAYHPGQLRCRRIVEALDAPAIRHFQSDGKWLELHRIPPASAGAETR